MPTRRIMELAIVVALLIKPAFGLLHLWAVKTLGSQPDGSLMHETAEVVAVLT